MKCNPPNSYWLILAPALICGCGETRTPMPAPPVSPIATPSIPQAADANPAATPATTEPEKTTQQATSQSTPTEQPKRQAIYSQAPGEELIAKALRQAQRDHKRVLIEWGFNGCSWCVWLHDLFQTDMTVHPLIHEEFVLVLVDSDKNQKLLKQYGGSDRQFSYPHLTVLDEQGRVLTNQNTEPLEKGKGHDPEVVAAFLKKWRLEKVDAEEAMAAALKQAAQENKRVLVRVGTPYCGWCTVLAQFMQDHAEPISKDYVDIKLDTLRMRHGEQVAARYHPAAGDPLGIPWMVILDSTGKTLASSVGSSGNIGYPYQQPEIEHFIGMLRETRQNLSDADLDQMQNDLVAYRTERESKKGP
jgi:thioredoxin-related protein